MSFFTVNRVSAAYGKTAVLRGISFSVENGCVVGVLGANGSGKTTLLKAIGNLLPHEGTCCLENTELEKLTSRQLAKLVSYIPQRSGISIDISALDVVLMGFNPQLGLLEHPNKEMKKAALKALEEVGLADCETKNYLHLSEGQKQLCILARTMVSGSKLLLLDEPESALDFQHRYRIMNQIRNWVEETGGSALVTLHDPVLALNSCDVLLLLKEGKVLDILMPKEVSLNSMEEQLSQIYGSISLQWCVDRNGRKQLVMLKEDET